MNISQRNAQETLNVGDIEGLIQLGTPDDEYSHEAECITAALAWIEESDITEGKLTEVIRRVWVTSFGPFSA